MRKYLMFLILVMGVNLGFAQQNEFFKEEKETYDRYELELMEEFKVRYAQASEFQKGLLKKQFEKVASKIDSARNVAYINALIKTKIELDLNKSEVKNEVKIPKNSNDKVDKDAEYPGGIDMLRAEVVNNFNTEVIHTDKEVLSTVVNFIVEKDGQISNVKAKGEHNGFNKQAEIAIYLLSNHFSPARKLGMPVRSFYKLPLKMRFE
ncbi:MAG: hypothetical protein Q4A00_04830 [Flavobacteriaceae bacterium]|nr:hypothetical protein [Flavobacteriaceae bacterium]